MPKISKLYKTAIFSLLAISLLASPAMAQDDWKIGDTRPAGDGCNFCTYRGNGAWDCTAIFCAVSDRYLSDPMPLEPRPQEASRDSQLLDFYRLRIANLERQVQVYEANDAESRKIIASQAETIKAWENRASGKMTKKDWIVLSLTVLAGVGTVVGR